MEPSSGGLISLLGFMPQPKSDPALEFSTAPLLRELSSCDDEPAIALSAHTPAPHFHAIFDQAERRPGPAPLAGNTQRRLRLLPLWRATEYYAY